MEGKAEVPSSAKEDSGEVAAGAAAVGAESPMESQDSAQPGGSREVEGRQIIMMVML